MINPAVYLLIAYYYLNKNWNDNKNIQNYNYHVIYNHLVK